MSVQHDGPESAPASSQTSARKDPFSLPPHERPEEYPIIEPGGPFQLPTRQKPSEPPEKTVPYTPAPKRYIPLPTQRREFVDNTPTEITPQRRDFPFKK